MSRVEGYLPLENKGGNIDALCCRRLPPPPIRSRSAGALQLRRRFHSHFSLLLCLSPRHQTCNRLSVSCYPLF